MDDLIAFIKARVVEDEVAANEALQETTGRWAARETAWPGGLVVEDECGAIILPAYRSAAPPQYPHIARHDPARVLREVAAKRAIVAEHGTGSDPCDAHGAILETIPCGALLAIASVWSDHPDYREEWKP